MSPIPQTSNWSWTFFSRFLQQTALTICGRRTEEFASKSNVGKNLLFLFKISYKFIPCTTYGSSDGGMSQMFNNSNCIGLTTILSSQKYTSLSLLSWQKDYSKLLGDALLPKRKISSKSRRVHSLQLHELKKICTALCQFNQYFLDIFKGHQVDFSLDLDMMSDARNETFWGICR